MKPNQDLLQRSMRGFGEMFHALAPNDSQRFRCEGAVGAHSLGSVGDVFFDSIVVFDDACATTIREWPAHHVWTTGRNIPGRLPSHDEPIPVMGMWLEDVKVPLPHVRSVEVETPSIREVALLNEEAYGVSGFQEFLEPLHDPRVALHGLRDQDGRFACVAMTLTVGDDVGIHYVATRHAERHKGLATSLISSVLLDATRRGARSATLQSSLEGYSVWSKLGFVELGQAQSWLAQKL